MPGVACQLIGTDDTSTYKDFTITVDPVAFGATRVQLRRALKADGIDTRCYFDPPIHRQQAYAGVATRPLPRTDELASRVLSLPVYPSLRAADVDRVVEVLAAAQASAPAIAAAP